MTRLTKIPLWLGRTALLATVFALAAPLTRAAEVIPPAPKQYFNDYAGIVPPATADALNQKLEQFERDTSNQIVVAVFPHMQTDSSIEDYTVRVAQSWHAGQKGRDNGAVLFVFMAEHKAYIQTGYGLEGALPDATCFEIIAHDIKPNFRAGNYAGGLEAAVNDMIAATRGEYKGTGSTADDSADQAQAPLFSLLFILVMVVFSFWSIRRRSRVYRGSGMSSIWWGAGGWGGGGWSGGGGGFGGGGFSGGGGGFGGGGAGGSW